MSLLRTTIQILFLLTAPRLQAQGSFVYDQQSATNTGISGSGYAINPGQPLGQAFTPMLSSVGFVQFKFESSPSPTNASIFVNLWADSIGGTLLGSTAPVFFPASFIFGPTNFFFATPPAVTPGVQYYLQPVIQSGGNNLWGILADFYNYPGAFYVNGVPQSNGINAWFREGVLVPEPPTPLFALLGAAMLVLAQLLATNRRPSRGKQPREGSAGLPGCSSCTGTGPILSPGP